MWDRSPLCSGSVTALVGMEFVPKSLEQRSWMFHIYWLNSFPLPAPAPAPQSGECWSKKDLCHFKVWAIVLAVAFQLQTEIRALLMNCLSKYQERLPPPCSDLPLQVWSSFVSQLIFPLAAANFALLWICYTGLWVLCVFPAGVKGMNWNGPVVDRDWSFFLCTALYKYL